MLTALTLLLAHLAGDAPRPPIEFARSPGPPQVVAVLQLRRENLPHSVRGEIYPVAMLDGESFIEVLAPGAHPFVGDAAPVDPTATTVLDSVREFTIYHRGEVVGSFSVDRIESAVYSCSAIRIGTGDLNLPDRLVQFGRYDPRVQPHAVSGQGFEYEYTLNYYVALSDPVEQADFSWDATFNPDAAERLREAILAFADDSLRGDPNSPWGPTAKWDAPRWSWEQGFGTYDLDRDGWAEGVGVVEALVTEPDATHGPRRFFATALVWVEDRGPDIPPQLLLFHRQAKAAQDWDFGYHLAEVLDINGDGVAELFYQVEDQEYFGYAILSFDGNRLVERFHGGAYGC